MLIFICRLQFLFARRQKCESAPKAGARSLEDLPSAKINIILETCKRLTVFYFLYSISITILYAKPERKQERCQGISTDRNRADKNTSPTRREV